MTLPRDRICSSCGAPSYGKQCRKCHETKGYSLARRKSLRKYARNQRLKINLTKEDKLWIVSSKKVSSQGKTKYDALRNFAEAIELYDEDNQC